MQSKNDNFYSNLEVHDIPISKLIGEKERFSRLPDDWYILVADIRNSTKAVQNGNHNHVNLVATGCVIAVLNLAEDYKLNIPFFFGGDGATFLIPPEIKEHALSVLDKHDRNTQKNFGFNLAIGSIRISEIYDLNIDLKIARAKINNALSIPVILGGGLKYAEDQIKENANPHTLTMDETPLNLNGMECKWDRIKPPKKEHEVLSLIISGCGKNDYARIYSRILQIIDDIYGSVDSRKPISVDKLRTKSGFQRIKDEMNAKFGRWSWLAFMQNWFMASFGSIYLNSSNSGKNYLKKLVELSDNLTLDGRINTVISGTQEQREKLLAYLDELEELNLIKYGYHVSEESIMSCYVKDIHKDQHIHFVDGGNGGYTKAANQLKKKFQDQLPA
ncbi:DUF3095 domain-containing protein [Gramella lutea]|uniref:DUF3095 domain-containing protein n=1 Tax=Christiangramia lutea TaxID=1607951 RepID=A0A9X2AA59_9FLAO|nr:DUF3095 family protein [Christiangramia lutea]MCH4822312.1 DUF3095 domain-containing protein [Christiangramia lutea]